MDVSHSIKNEISTWTQHIQGVCGESETRFDGQSPLFIGELKYFLLGQTEIAFIKSNANFVEPTLLKVTGVDDPLFIEETFGPVIDVIPFESDEELISMMNHSRFGLTASLWSNDLSKILRLIPQIEAGSVWVNMHTFLDPSVSFSGVKASGLGHEFSDAFIEAYTELRSVMIRY